MANQLLPEYVRCSECGGEIDRRRAWHDPEKRTALCDAHRLQHFRAECRARGYHRAYQYRVQADEGKLFARCDCEAETVLEIAVGATLQQIFDDNLIPPTWEATHGG